MNPYINAAVMLLIAFVGGAGGNAAWKGITNRRGVKAEAGRTEAEAEVAREEAQKKAAERKSLLSDVERAGYAASARAADERYQALKEDYIECRRVQAQTLVELREVRASVEPMLRAFDALMARVIPTNGSEVTVTMTKVEIDTVRAAMSETRSHLA